MDSSYIIIAPSIKEEPVGSIQTPIRTLHPITTTAHTGTGITISHQITEQRKSSFGTKHRTTGIPYHAKRTPNQPFPLTWSQKKLLLIQTPTHHIIKHQFKPETHTPSPTCQDKPQAPPPPRLHNPEEGKSNSQTITQAIGQNLRNSFFSAFFSQQNLTGTKPIWTKFPQSSHA